MSRQVRKIELTKTEKKALYKRIRLTKDRKTADRLRVILYKAQGRSHFDIVDLLGLSINTLTNYLQIYQQSGLEKLCQTGYGGSQPLLTLEQRNQLKIELMSNIYTSSEQVMIWLEKNYGVYYTRSGVQKLLKRLGFTYKKNKLMPSKADPDAQEQFVAWFRKKRAQLGENDLIYFGDAAHVIHNAEAGYGWSQIGEPHYIPSNSGRRRCNILGAYCTQTHESVFILTEDNINQDSIIQLLGKLHAKHQIGKIYLILDNAPYNKALRVRAHAKLFGIIIKFQPTYSPNLNLIERVWKFMRSELFKDKYTDTFDKFKQKLDGFFTNLDKSLKKLKTLLTEEFETLPSNWQCPILVPFSQI